MRPALFILGLVSLAVEAARMPDCTLTSLDGSQIHTLRELHRSRVLYVDFWASWCTSCAKSFQFLNALEEDLHDHGFAVVGINLDEDPKDAPRFLERFPARFTVLADPGGRCARAFAVQGMPASYVIDRSGAVRLRHLGFRAGDMEELRRVVEALVAGP